MHRGNTFACVGAADKRTTLAPRFEYDAAGRLVVINDDAGNPVEEYTYGASRNRLINETAGGKTYYAWGGSSPIAEYAEATSSNSPEWRKSYVYAGSRLLSTATKAGAGERVEYHHPDRLGTTLVTEPVAGTSSRQSTLPFGKALDAESTDYSNQVFTSYDRSPATGLDYAVNRTYSPGQSRFTQADPIGMASASAGDPQSLNLFSYVRNNPIDYVDPSGLNKQAPGSGGQRGILWTLYYGNDVDGYKALFSWFVPYPDEGEGGDGGGGDFPSDLRDRLVDRANNCKTFLEKYFNALSKYGELYSTDVGKLFDRIGLDNFIVSNEYMGKHRSSAQTRGMAVIKKGKRLVYSIALSNNESEATNNNYAAVALAEVLHHAKMDGKYSDEELDKAALSLLSEEDQKRVKKENKNNAPGTIGHNAVSNNCGPTNPYGPPPSQK